MKKIKVDSRTKPLAVFAFILAIALLSVFFIFVFFDKTSSSHTKSRIIEFFFAIALFLPVFFSSYFKKGPYISDLIIYDDSIALVYKNGNKKLYTRKILKSNIKEFNYRLCASNERNGRYSWCHCLSEVKILLNDSKTFEFSVDSNGQLFGCAYQFALDVLKESKQIPNFKFRFRGGNDYVKREIEYFVKHGKKKSFLVRLKEAPVILKLALCFFAACIGVLIYSFLPDSNLSDNEKEFMNNYNAAVELRSENDPETALIVLDKAALYISDDSALYLERAYNLEKLERYSEALEAAKEGLKYASKRSVYYKYNNFKMVSSSHDAALYTIIGRCAEKIKDYSSMLEAYDYILKHTKYTYTDAYFGRAKAYYYLRRYNDARKDFLEHKKIIEKYFSDQAAELHKDLYPRYNQKDLDNVELWLNACEHSI